MVYLDPKQHPTLVLDRFEITTAKHKARTIPAANYKNLYLATEEDVRFNTREYQQGIGSLIFARVLKKQTSPLYLKTSTNIEAIQLSTMNTH